MVFGPPSLLGSLPQIEQVSQLAALVHAQLQYHTRSAEILTQLSSKIDERSVLPPLSVLSCPTETRTKRWRRRFSERLMFEPNFLLSRMSFLYARIRDTSNKPRKEFVPKPRTSMDFSISENHNGGLHGARSPGEARWRQHNPGCAFYFEGTFQTFSFFIFNCVSVFQSLFILERYTY